MDIQSAPPTYTPMGDARHPTGNPPVLGAQVPGMTGGMPAQSGLSVMKNPMAKELESRGRSGDSMLVHMAPEEVGGLQNLAMAMGGSLSINPETGLVEANFLKKILPTLLGAGLSFIPGVGPLLAAGIVGGGQTLLTGDLNKGLMAGLQAFGGASLGGALAAPAASAASAAPVAGNLLGASGAGSTIGTGLSGIGSSLAPGAAALAPGALAASAAPLAGAAAKTGLAGFGQRFAAEAASGGLGGMAAKYAPYAAGAGVLSGVSDATTPQMNMPGQENKSIYEGPYMPQQRRVQPRVSGPGGEIQFFDRVNPYPGFLTKSGGMPTGYAEGGSTESDDLSKKSHDYLVTQGYTDPTTGQRGQLVNHPFEAGLSAGARSSLGGVDFVVNEQGKWVADATPKYTGPSIRQNVEGSTGLATAALDPTSKQSTSTTPSEPTRNPGSTQLALGVDILNTPYTPRFTQVPDFRTPTPRVADGGAKALASLADAVSSFRTSPGPITASRKYEGGSPSERLRAQASTNEKDYGFAKSSRPTAGSAFSGVGGIFDSGVNASPYGGTFNPYGGSGQFGYYGGGEYNRSEADGFYAEGGQVNMDNGSFVVDARTVSELGNGSSNAGIERLASMGGQPVRGSGDGVSDSVSARIGGTQEARVARDEVIFSPGAVTRLGSGDHSKGTKKLYALMEKAHKARKKAGRGQDTKVAKGLGSLA